MSNRIPDNLIEEIRLANDIVEVISEHLSLKKVGKYYKTLCPFHQEKTPSFIVTPERQIYHCFGCGKGGNVYGFLMEYEKVSFFEAIKTLAKRAGINLPTREEKKEGNDLLYQANEFAAKFYREILLSEKGKGGREYLIKRGINEETQEEFRLGYAPDAWDELLKAGGRKSLSSKILKDAGLIIEREDKSGFYDRFRNRLMFPIFSTTGRVVGFGGRSLETKEEAKYVNSPETAIYQKGRTLYGLFQAKNEIRQKEDAILVEGNFDLLIPYQAGFKNIVASLGTALTEEQVKVLSRYTSKVFIVYDGDSAGLNAALKAIDLLLEANLEVKVSRLPKETDPDNLIRSQGKEAFSKVLQSATDFVDFKLALFSEKSDLREIAQKAKIAELLLESMRKVRDEMRQRLYLNKMAQRLALPEEILWHSLTVKRKTIKEQFAFTPPAIDLSHFETELLGFILTNPDKISERIQDLMVEGFSDHRCQEILKEIIKAGEKIDFADSFNHLSQDSQSLFSEILVKRDMQEKAFGGDEEEITRAIQDYLKKIRKIKLEQKIKEIKTLLVTGGGDKESTDNLLREYHSLKKETVRGAKGENREK
ncbi:MAG: DNA primase [Candidatus Edwardsbacteria bacterium]